MTKRRLESDLEELSEELLGDLTPSERLEIALTANATGNVDWVTQLSETCPRARYDQPEMAFTVRKQFAFTLAQQAVYDLRTTTLLFGWTDTKREIQQILTSYTDLDSAEFKFEPLPKGTRATLFRKLYVYYEGYARFADANLGVTLAEWLALHPDGPATVEMAEAMLEGSAGLREVAEAEYTDEDEKEASLDDVADQFTESLQARWDEMLDKIE